SLLSSGDVTHSLCRHHPQDRGLHRVPPRRVARRGAYPVGEGRAALQRRTEEVVTASRSVPTYPRCYLSIRYARTPRKRLSLFSRASRRINPLRLCIYGSAAASSCW